MEDPRRLSRRDQKKNPLGRGAKEVDWTDIANRLRIGYPGDSRWNYKNFGNQPIIQIEKALSTLSRVQKEQANLISIPIANIGVAYAQSQGAKEASTDWFNPWQYQFKIESFQELIDFPTKNKLKALIKNEQAPFWAVRQLDQEFLEYILNDSAIKGGKTFRDLSTIEFLIGRLIFAVNFTISKGILHCGILFFKQSSDPFWRSLNPETGERYRIYTPVNIDKDLGDSPLFDCNFSIEKIPSPEKERG